MHTYTQLSLQEREQFHALLWDKMSLRAIGKIMGRSPSTLSREFNRHNVWQVRRYSPSIAQRQYEESKIKSRQRPRLKDPKIVKYVKEKLSTNWSPEQIAGRWNRNHKKLKISHEAIYQYIYADTLPGKPGDLRPLLRRRHKRRLRRYLPWNQRTPRIMGRISIEERPAAVNSRRFYGHWEGDSVDSIKSSPVCLNTLNERKSKLVRITKLPKHNSEYATKAMIDRLSEYPPKLRQTLTLDNGSENAKHAEITKATNAKVFFTHPYSAHERGTNENTNGLIRYYFPKNTDFARVPEEDIKRVENLLNNRPRKALNYRTPLEAFNKVCCT